MGTLMIHRTYDDLPEESRRKIADMREHIRSDEFDVSSPRDGATFWSGDKVANDTLVEGQPATAGDGRPRSSDEAAEGKGYFELSRNYVRAEHAVADGERTRLESTPGGRWLQQQDLKAQGFDGNERAALWEEASEKYAQGASGDVSTRIVGAEDTSVFRKVELPTLLDNDKVTSINGVPRDELRQQYAADPEAAYAKVRDGELDRSREHVDGSGDRTAALDLKQRESIRDIEDQNRLGTPDSRGSTKLDGPLPTPANENGPAPPGGGGLPVAGKAARAAGVGEPGPSAEGSSVLAEFNARPPPPPPPPAEEQAAERGYSR
jgi:hypothetical protein